MALNEEKINDLMFRIINENMEYRNEMLEELLIHTLRGETLVLVEQKTYDGSIIKYQYQWQRIKLPEIPLEEPEAEDATD